MKNIKSTLNDLGFSFIKKIGYLVNPVVLKFMKEDKQLLVFFFHGLFESVKQKDLNLVYPQNNMTVEQYVDFIDYLLSHNDRCIMPDDLIEGLKNDQPYTMITFDDGYVNNMLAIEILNKYKIPAVFFMSTLKVKSGF